LMPVIQYVLPSKSKQLKKLVHFYWEVCPKYEDGKEGTLRQEMILVCNAIRNDLQHPNEYIRGATLRFLQKIREVELLEPLVPTARACLEHRHQYVRKNAIFAIFSIYKVAEHLVPDAAELLETFLAAESDPTCLRNAFVALSTISPPTALQWLKSNLDSVAGMDEVLQLSIVEVIRKEGPRVSAADKAKYIRLALELLSSNSRGVKYEAATTLTGLTGNPSAVQAAANCYISLITKESDNNVKLIVLERLDALRERFEGEGVLEALVVDLLAVLS
ncbi:ARM repeat-containing protein, partial [Atractiella rhizophila]